MSEGQAKELQKVDEVISGASSQFVSTLTQYKWDLIPDSQLHAAKQALTKSDYIMKIACGNPGAVHEALINSAILGLDLTNGKRQGWLLPRKNQQGKTVIQLQVGYKGVEAIHQRMGVIDRLVIRVVRENDEFEWSGDDQEKPNHKANWFDSDEKRGKPKGVFSITYFPDKSIHVMAASINEVYEKHRDRSDSWKTYVRKQKEGGYNHPPPWVTDEKSMIEKTMAYIASKQWPANIRDDIASSKILETLHDTDIKDYQTAYTVEQESAFFDFVKERDELGLYLFTQRVGAETYSNLMSKLKSTFPKGQKMKMSKDHNELVAVGRDIWLKIIEALDCGDCGLLSENIDNISNITKKLLISNLSTTQKNEYEILITEMGNDNDQDN